MLRVKVQTMIKVVKSSWANVFSLKSGIVTMCVRKWAAVKDHTGFVIFEPDDTAASGHMIHAGGYENFLSIRADALDRVQLNREPANI